MDAQNVVKNVILSQLEAVEEKTLLPLIRKIAHMLLSYNRGVPVSKETSLDLMKHTSSRPKKLEIELPVLLVKVNGIRQLVVKIPNIPHESEGSKQNLAHMLEFACKVLAVDLEQVRLIREPLFGTEIHIPVPISRLYQNMIQSVQSSQGDFSGEPISTNKGFKGNLVEMLAAMKILRSYGGLIRKLPKIRGDSFATTIEDLREMFNTRSGLSAPMASYTKSFTTAVLAQLVKFNNDMFPAGWIHSVKVRNSVSSKEGLIPKLGYCFKVPSTQKLKEVIFTSYVKDQESSKEWLNPFDILKTPEGISYQAFRTAIVLSLPKIDPQSDKSLKDQLASPPTVRREPVVIDYFEKKSSIVEALNTAYSIKTAISRKGGKARPLHFLYARNRVLALSANTQFMDASGKIYQKFSDIPLNIREFFQKTFCKTLQNSDDLDNIKTDDTGQQANLSEDTKRSDPMDQITLA
jgi:hypothetical protein